jgi:nucleotide sugar dehydrogenase
MGTDLNRLATALTSDRFTVTTEPSALSRARCVIIAVPTPVDEHSTPDLLPLQAACATVVEQAVPGQVIILTSTTYVGCTSDFLVAGLKKRGLRVGQDIFVAFSPERIDPGNDHHTHEEVPRVVGGVSPRCTEEAARCLAGYVNTVHRVSSARAAELTKLYENSFRAVNIALANELSQVTRTFDLDIIEVIEAAATKPFGFMPFFPGPGVGGHCIPCDPHYLVWQLRAHRQRVPLIEQAMISISERPGYVIDRIRELLSDNNLPLMGTRILLVGVAYKPDVEDIRESPALEILHELQALGAKIYYHDPLVPSVRLSDGTVMYSVDAPGDTTTDLVVLHTVHRKVDLAWVDRDRPLLLDATYRQRDLSRRVTL